MPSDTTILYLADPMCSWCWGFKPSLHALQDIAPETPIRIVLGGLAPDSQAPMEDSMRAYVQQAWRDVSVRSGVSFNFDFWTHCKPRRSTYPACRAVIVARQKGLETAMFEAIQRAYYQEARNPSDLETLAEIGESLGMVRKDFLSAMLAPTTQQFLDEDFQLRDDLQVKAFPSLGVQRAGELHLLHSGWCNPSELQKIWRLWNHNL